MADTPVVDENLDMLSTGEAEKITPELQREIKIEAKDRFEYAEAAFSYMRRNFIEDYKFAHGDAMNHYQWIDTHRQSRESNKKPALTINMVRQHNLQIINDAKQNKPAIRYRPVGDSATYEAAQIREALARHIEYQSNASVAYDTATEFQVKAGYGVIRVATDWTDEKSFDQDIFIRRVGDPLSVYFDPDAKEFDRSDGLYAFIFDDYDEKEFAKIYPQWAKKAGSSALGADGIAMGWYSSERVRVAEYFRKNEILTTLYNIPGEMIGEQFKAGPPMPMLEDVIPAALRKEIMNSPKVRRRRVRSLQVEWYFIVGEQVVEFRRWPGKYIPLVPVIGEEARINGQLDWISHTRCMTDSQRMYNYMASAAVEHIGLQTKTPWMAAAEAIEDHLDDWKVANTENPSVLIYNGFNEAGEAITPPQRIEGPAQAAGYVAALQASGQDIMMVSGQYQPTMGEPSNERSGKALSERQRQGDNATYHFIDNQGVAIRLVGRIIDDLIPHIYDTPRVLQVLAENGDPIELQMDPNAKQAFTIHQLETQEGIKRVLNPMMGSFDVQADIGPSYGTRREQAFDALATIITQAPQLTAIIGDILLEAGDFPGAREAAKRLKRMVPPQAMGTGPTQSEQMLQQQVTQLSGLVQKLTDELSGERLKMKGKAEARDISAFEAVTHRLAALQKMLPLDEEGLKKEVRQILSEAFQIDLSPTVDAATRELEPWTWQGAPEHPEVPGAKMAPDGNYYTPDPAREGKFMMIRKGLGQGPNTRPAPNLRGDN